MPQAPSRRPYRSVPPERAGEVLSAARAAWLRGDLEAAAAKFDALALVIPQMGDATFLGDLSLHRAAVALATGDIPAARVLLDEIAGIPDLPEYRSAPLRASLAAMIGDHPAASAGFWSAILRARVVGDTAGEARNWANLAVVYLDMRRLEDVAGALSLARALGPDVATRPFVDATEAVSEMFHGHWVAAEAALSSSIEGAAHGPNLWAQGAAHAARAVPRARAGRIDEAVADLDTARTLLARDWNPWTLRTVDVWAAFVDWWRPGDHHARARNAWEAAGDDLGDGALVERDAAARIAARLFGEVSGLGPVPVRSRGGGWAIRPDGSALCAGNQGWVAVRGAAQRRVLLALVRAAEDAPGEPVGSEALVAAGWPGERLVRGSGLNRLYVALHVLRAAGLASLLVTRQGGYLLAVPPTLVNAGGGGTP